MMVMRGLGKERVTDLLVTELLTDEALSCSGERPKEREREALTEAIDRVT